MKKQKERTKNQKLKLIKSKKFQIIIVILFVGILLYVVMNRKEMVVYNQVVLPAWTEYHKEFQLDEIDINEKDKSLIFRFEWDTSFGEKELIAAENTYRKLVEKLFEENSNYYDYTAECMFAKVSQHPYLYIGNITKELDKIEVEPEIYLSNAVIAEAFPETAILDAGRITCDSMEELSKFDNLKEIHALHDFSDTEKRYIHLNYPELYDILGLQDKWKYEEASEISMLAVDYVSKYTEQYTGCPLYTWTEEVVLPFPAPCEDVTMIVGAENEEFMVAQNVTSDIWSAYVESLSGKYITESETVESEDFIKEKLTIFDMEHNFMAELIWTESAEMMSVNVMMFCQEDELVYTNEEMAERIKYWLGCEREDIFAVMNISSHSNLDNGDSVYYIWHNDLKNNTDKLSCSLAVVTGEDISCLEDATVHPGCPDEIEVIYENGKHYAALLTHDSTKEQIIEIYYLSTYCELQKTIKVKDIEVVKKHGYQGLITMKKEDGEIKLYKLEQISENGPYVKGELLE